MKHKLLVTVDGKEKALNVNDVDDAGLELIKKLGHKVKVVVRWMCVCGTQKDAPRGDYDGYPTFPYFGVWRSSGGPGWEESEWCCSEKCAIEQFKKLRPKKRASRKGAA